MNIWAILVVIIGSFASAIAHLYIIGNVGFKKTVLYAIIGSIIIIIWLIMDLGWG